MSLKKWQHNDTDSNGFQQKQTYHGKVKLYKVNKIIQLKITQIKNGEKENGKCIV